VIGMADLPFGPPNERPRARLQEPIQV